MPANNVWKHMRKLHHDVATTNKFSDLLEDKELDAIVVATPVRFHYEMAKAALLAGKHVFVENLWLAPWRKVKNSLLSRSKTAWC